MLSDKIREIKFDRSSGASQIARNTLGVLRFFAKTRTPETSRGFVEDFTNVGRRLFEARPNIAPVQNLVAQIIYEVSTFQESNLVSVQKFAVSRIDELCNQSEDAVKESAGLAAKLVGGYDCLASCSYSSTVCETFRLAKQQGKRLKVFVSESRSADGKFCYGNVLAKFLESVDVLVDIFPDNKLRSYVPKTKCVFVGVDSILFDGAVINGKPTCELAVVAKDCGVPFYCVCETSKANTLSYLGGNVELTEGFDLVPENLITGIVTEKGILDANELVKIMMEKSKFFEIFQIK